MTIADDPKDSKRNKVDKVDYDDDNDDFSLEEIVAGRVMEAQQESSRRKDKSLSAGKPGGEEQDSIELEGMEGGIVMTAVMEGERNPGSGSNLKTGETKKFSETVHVTTKQDNENLITIGVGGGTGDLVTKKEEEEEENGGKKQNLVTQKKKKCLLKEENVAVVVGVEKPASSATTEIITKSTGNEEAPQAPDTISVRCTPTARNNGTASTDENLPPHGPPPSLTPSRPISLPGAYSYRVGGEIRRADSDDGLAAIPRDISVSSSSSSVADEESQLRQQTASNTAGLVVANPIQNEEHLGIHRPIATPTTTYYREHHRQDQVTSTGLFPPKQKRCFLLILVVGIAVVLIGVVVLVSLLSRGSSSTNNINKDGLADTATSTTSNISSTFNPNGPELSLSEQILNILPNYTVVTIAQDTEALSPQSRAFQWLLRDPNLANYTKERILQRFALSTLFYSTTPDPQMSIGYEGRGWNNDTGWLDYSVHECDWIFFKIAAWLNTVMQYNVHLKGPCWESDNDNAVQGETYRHLMLPNNGLEGTIPEEVYLLTSLKTIVLDSNALHGTLSTRIGQLSTNLEYFAVSANQNLGGTLPSQLGMLNKLRYAYLFANQFTGTMPTELARLSNLEFFGLFLTSITGTIPEHFAPPAMKNLYLSFNQLSGTIPTMFGSMSKLERLALRVNQMTGTLPTEIGQWTNCWQFNVDMNDFSGEIPQELGQLVVNGSLLNMNFTGNRFVGTVPSDLCLLGTPEYQNRTPPPNVVIPSPAYLGHDCNNQLCGCHCNCSAGLLH